MQRSTLLTLDGLGNIVLGLLLLSVPVPLAAWLGIPNVSSGFYPSLFGAVLVGIGIALLLERRRYASDAKGLGLGGTLTINLCFGLVLAGWLLFGGLGLPVHGAIVLCALVLILVGLGGIELMVELSGRPTDTA